MRDTIANDCDRPMIYARRNGFEICLLSALQDRLRLGIRGNVDVRDRHVQQRIAHTTAHKKRLITITG